MPAETADHDAAGRNQARLARLRDLVARHADSEWGRSHIPHVLTGADSDPPPLCSRYAGLLDQSGDGYVILAPTVNELAGEMSDLSVAELSLVPVALVDLDTGEQRSAHRRTVVTFAPAGERSATPATSGAGRPAKREAIALDRTRIAELERDGRLVSVAAESPTRGEDARRLLLEAYQGGVFVMPAGLVLDVEADDDEDCWVRLTLTTEEPGGVQCTPGWGLVTGGLTNGVLLALAHAAEELSDLLRRVDPRTLGPPRERCE